MWRVWKGRFKGAAAGGPAGEGFPGGEWTRARVGKDKADPAAGLHQTGSGRAPAKAEGSDGGGSVV